MSFKRPMRSKNVRVPDSMFQQIEEIRKIIYKEIGVLPSSAEASRIWSQGLGADGLDAREILKRFRKRNGV